VLGTHDGHQQYTIGQRRGLHLALGEPRYVTEKDPTTNTVTIGPRSDLARAGCTANESVWHIEPQTQWFPCRAQVRAHGEVLPARVRCGPEDTLEIEFATPHDAIAPGQAVVCYQGEHVCCGGWIDRTLPANATFDTAPTAPSIDA
jgi:tRNA-specific 2-thiouridylase